MIPPIKIPPPRVDYYYALVATIENTEYGVIICKFDDCKSPADLRVIGLSKFHANFDDSLQQLGKVEYPLFRIEIIGTTRYNYKNYWIGADQRMDHRDCMTAPEQRRLTNKELSEWIAKGNGQGRVKGTNTANTFYMYDSNEDSEPVPTTIEVRTWDGEWHEPTADYCKFATFTEDSK